MLVKLKKNDDYKERLERLEKLKEFFLKMNLNYVDVIELYICYMTNDYP